MARWIVFSAKDGSALEIEADEIKRNSDIWLIRASGTLVGEFNLSSLAGYVLAKNLPLMQDLAPEAKKPYRIQAFQAFPAPVFSAQYVTNSGDYQSWTSKL